MTPALALFETYLQALKWRYQRDPERELVHFGVNGTHGPLRVMIHVVAELDIVKCFTTYPLRVPEAQRPAIAEYLTRANYGLTLGNFEMDFADGEVRFRTSMSTDDGALNAAVAAQLLQQNISTADRYRSGLQHVLNAVRTPQAAIVEVEAEG